MKILVVCPKIPYPPTDGGRIAIFEPLRRLASRGHVITLLTFCQVKPPDEILVPLRQYCRLELIEHDTRTHLYSAASNVFSPTPYTVSKYHSASLSDMMRSLLNESTYELVQLEQLHMAFYRSISKEFNIPTILRQHNIESSLAESYSNSQRGLRRLYAHIQAVKLRRYEAEMCARMDLCLTFTEADSGRLRELNPDVRTAVIPAGIDPDFFHPEPGLEEQYAIVSVAAMDWPPNIDAILWFHRGIFPIIQKRFPQVRLYIVGKNPPGKILALKNNKNVSVTGFVDNPMQYFAKASVFIVPLLSGGGMRIKILEAMAMSKAIVSTTIGAEGISVVNGKDMLLADDPENFAGGVCRLLGDSELRKQLGENARNLVAGRYTWDQSVDLLETAYKNIC